MRVKFSPKDREVNQAESTNIGTLLPDEVMEVPEYLEHEARRLIANGEFSETDEDVNGGELRQKAADASLKEAVAEGKRAAKLSAPVVESASRSAAPEATSGAEGRGAHARDKASKSRR